jgi:hypothetical protein
MKFHALHFIANTALHNWGVLQLLLQIPINAIAKFISANLLINGKFQRDCFYNEETCRISLIVFLTFHPCKTSAAVN